jgi:hypothetical protein
MDQELKVAFEALTKDASVWDDVGDTLEAGHGDVEAISVNRGAFSFAATDVADSYFELQTRVADLLKSGATETRAGAGALRAVRNDFERLEDVTASELYKIWKPAE